MLHITDIWESFQRKKEMMMKLNWKWFNWKSLFYESFENESVGYENFAILSDRES